VGKWHLGHGGVHDPRGFDHWCVFPDQGAYHDPEMLELGRPRRLQGYATDLVTDLAIGWIEARDPSRPFCVLVHHKAPHRPWLPDDEHAGLYQADQIPEPPTFGDDYRHRSAAAAQARMRVADDLGVEDLKAVVPPGLAGDQRASWAYQRYIRGVGGWAGDPGGGAVAPGRLGLAGRGDHRPGAGGRCRLQRGHRLLPWPSSPPITGPTRPRPW
jgi:hypothetical protein